MSAGPPELKAENMSGLRRSPLSLEERDVSAPPGEAAAAKAWILRAVFGFGMMTLASNERGSEDGIRT